MSKLRKALDIAVRNVGNAVMAKDWIVQEIRNLTKGEIIITEWFINNCISEFTQNHAIELHDGKLVYKASDLVPMAKNIEIDCTYDSCDFRSDTKSVTIRLLDIKPFYLKPALLAIPFKYPFIKISRDAESTRLISCNLNEIPSLRDNKILNSPALKYLTIKYLKCEAGKATIKLGLTGTPEDIIRDVKQLIVSEKGMEQSGDEMEKMI